jgi:MFS family permease
MAKWLNHPTKQNPVRRLIIAIVLSATLMPLNSTMIAVALPAIGEAFLASRSDLTLWLVTSYLLINIVLQSSAGKLGDILGRRRVFTMGISFFAAGALMAIFIPLLSAVAVSRVLMAIGGAMIMPNAMALLRVIVTKQRRARAFGYFSALLGVSAAIGPPVGGLLIEHFGWKSIFLVNLPILLVSWILIGSRLPPELDPTQTRPGRSHFDVIGMGLFGCSLGVLVIGLKFGGYWSLCSTLLCGLGLYYFVRWERITADPLIDPYLFRHIPFVVGGSIVGLHNLGMYALLFQLPYWLKETYKLEPDVIGLVLLPMMLFMVIFSFAGGRIAEYMGARSTILVGATGGLLGMLILYFTVGSASLLWMVIALACVGGSIGIVSGPIYSEAMSAIPPHQSGVAAGVLSTMRYLGGVIGITVISMVLSETDSAGMLAQNKFSFGIYAGAYLLALLLALKLSKEKNLASH